MRIGGQFYFTIYSGLLREASEEKLSDCQCATGNYTMIIPLYI